MPVLLKFSVSLLNFSDRERLGLSAIFDFLPLFIRLLMSAAVTMNDADTVSGVGVTYASVTISCSLHFGA